MSTSQDTPTPELGILNSAKSTHNAIGTHLVDERYETIEKIGSGGMGEVFKAYDKTLGRFVAVKFLARTSCSDTAIQRFQLEAKATSALDHEYIVDIYDFGIAKDGTPFMVMELVSGVTLADIIKKHKLLSLRETITLAKQIAQAMGHAHDRKIIHRDLKPGNIVVSKSDGQLNVKILDFGVSSIQESNHQFLTRTGQIVGSPRYLSPEQAMGKPADNRSDIYSLGCIIYECLSGETPFGADNSFKLLQKHILEVAPDLGTKHPEKGISKDLSAMVQKCLCKNPSDRFQSMSELFNILNECSATFLIDDFESVIDENTSNAEKIEIETETISRYHLPRSILIILAALICFSIAIIYFMNNHNQEEISSFGEESSGFAEIDAKNKNGQTTFGGMAPSLDKNWLRNQNIHNNVKIVGINFDDEEFAYICSRKLVELKLDSVDLSIKKAEILGRCMSLKSLSLKYSGLTDQCIKTLSKIKKIERLNIEGNPNLSAKSLEIISTEFPFLTSLDIGQCNFNGEDLKHLTGPRQLYSLDLKNLDIVDSDLEPVFKLPELKIVDLNRNQSITPKVFELFAKESKSQNRRYEVRVDRCPLISEEAVSLARQKYPNLVIKGGD